MTAFSGRSRCERTTVNWIIVAIVIVSVCLLVALLAGLLQPVKPATPVANPCQSNPCKNNGTCTVRGNSYSCNCTVGWTGSQCSDRFNLAVLSSTGDKTYRVLGTDGNEVIGLAAIGDILYVVCTANDTIYAFNRSQEYRRTVQLEFKVPGMVPLDMAADSRNGVLYISDSSSAADGGQRILRVNPDTKNSSYFVNATDWIGTLSVDPNGRVLGVSITDILNVVDNSNSAALSHRLPINISSSQHAVLSSDSVLYVSHGSTTDESHMVSSLNFTSEPFEIYDRFGSNAPGNGTTGLHRPCHLATSRNGEIYVADYWNRRVVVLFSNLTFNRIAMDHTGSTQFGWPQRLSVTTDGDLLVGMTQTSLISY